MLMKVFLHLILINLIMKMVHFAYLVDSIDMWHGRFGNENLGYIKKKKKKRMNVES